MSVRQAQLNSLDRQVMSSGTGILDESEVTSVLEVTGLFGVAMLDPPDLSATFTCHAIFVDGEFGQTSVSGSNPISLPSPS